MKNKSLFRIIVTLIATSSLLFIFAAYDEDLKPVPSEVRIGYESISGNDALSLIKFLACDELEGRDTASRGLRIARKYITSLYELWDLAPAGDMGRGVRGYEQLIRLNIIEEGPEADLEVRTSTTTRRFLYALDVFPASLEMPGTVEAPVSFVGYGIHAPELGYDDFAGIDLTGRIAMVFFGLPGSMNTDSPFSKPENSSKYGGFSERLEQLQERGAVAALFISPGEMSTSTLYKYVRGGRIYPKRVRLVAPSLLKSPTIPHIGITEHVANALFASVNTNWEAIKESIDSSLKPHSIEFQGITVAIKIDAKLRADVSGNLLGMIEGSDPELKDEFVLICAHLDHFGMTEDRYVFNGADDNASGSAAVIELAHAFALNPTKPRRSIIFAHWTAEERGLVGSEYFADFPTVPLDKIVVCLNLDMVGREFTIENLENWKRRFGSPEGMETINAESINRVVMAAASYESKELPDIINSVNSNYCGLVCPLRPCIVGYGSDEDSFYLKKVPSVMFSAAMHEDYHTADDTSDKISPAKVQQIARLAYLVAAEIANRPERLKWEE